MLVHLLMSVTVIFVIILFKVINDESVIAQLFTFAGYTYGPLLGLYAFGLFTKWQVNDKWVPVVAIIAPFLSYVIKINSADWFGGYQIGFELLLINGLITFLGLLFIIKNK